MKGALNRQHVQLRNQCFDEILLWLQADIRPQTDGCNGLRYNLTSDIIESIFRTYPAGEMLPWHMNLILNH